MIDSGNGLAARLNVGAARTLYTSLSAGGSTGRGNLCCVNVVVAESGALVCKATYATLGILKTSRLRPIVLGNLSLYELTYSTSLCNSLKAACFCPFVSARCFPVFRGEATDGTHLRSGTGSIYGSMSTERPLRLSTEITRLGGRTRCRCPLMLARTAEELVLQVGDHSARGEGKQKEY